MTTGTSNIAIGGSCMDAGVTGNSNVAIGHNAMTTLTSGGTNTAVGHSSAAALTTGSNNTFFGSTSGDALTTGSENTFVGSAAGGAQTTASQNTAVGFAALDAVVTARLRGQTVFSEALSQHLFINDSVYRDKDWRTAAHHVMSPPFRSKKHQDALKKFGVTSHHRKTYKPIHKILSQK